MKKAIVLGATGLIGGHVLKLLLADERYSSVVAITRKPMVEKHPKLKNRVGDLFAMNDLAIEFQDGDDLFIAIGTTLSKTPNKEVYEKIDFGITVAAAKVAFEKGVKTAVVVSAMGANAKSFVFYNALKGKMENSIQSLGFENLNFVRPSLLLGDRNEHRSGENVAAVLMTKLDFLIPKKSKAIKGEVVARAMVYLANTPSEQTVWTNDKLFELGAKN